MDLALFFRVLWRFKLIMVPALIAATALGLLSVAKVDPSKFTVTYRKPQQYVAYSTLFVTKPGFPWGRLTVGSDQQGHFTSLAIIYANLLPTDQVRKRMNAHGEIPGRVEAAPVTVPTSGEALPLIRIAAIATSPSRAITLSQRASDALRTWVLAQQNATETPEHDRVLVQQIARADKATLFEGRSKTLAIVVFLSVLIAAAALAFVLENLRPRDEDLEDAGARRVPDTTHQAA